MHNTIPPGGSHGRTLDDSQEKICQTHFSQFAWINKKPMTSITAQVTP